MSQKFQFFYCNTWPLIFAVFAFKASIFALANLYADLSIYPIGLLSIYMCTDPAQNVANYLIKKN